jgi:hypothetical protein
MKRQAPYFIVAVLLTVLSLTSWASAAPAGQVAKKQRIAVTVTFPHHPAVGKFVLTTLTDGRLRSDFGSVVSNPTQVFNGRIINGQSVDRFRGIETLKGKRGTLVIRFQEDFVSAGNGYQVGAGTWAVDSGTGTYTGLTGGGRSAVVVPSGKFGFTQYEGFVTAAG